MTKHHHYHAMNGEHGCTPDSNDVCESYREAVDTLIDRFDLGRTRAKDLRQSGYLELTPRDGAAYCEVTECQESDCMEEG